MNRIRLLIGWLLASASLNAQIILAPDLQCVQNDNVNSNITLSWTNPPNNPCGAFIQYTIYASSSGPAGPYTAYPVTNQSATSFTLTGLLGTSPTWDFYMQADYNCPGATVLSSDTVNNLAPITPFIVNVDVTQSGTVIFNWEPSPSPETHFYVIYYYLSNGNAVPLDTVYGRFNTTYTDVIGDPTIQSLVYTVAAVDSCGNSSAFNTEPHNTIFLQASTSACEDQIALVWNKYINWPVGVLRYDIYAGINGAVPTLAGTIDSAATAYNFGGFNDGDSVCLYIHALSADDTTIISNSNMVCMQASIVQPPAYNYITNATVDTDNHISITWMIDTLAELTFFKVERSSNNNSYFQVEQRPAPSPLGQFQQHVDSTDILPEKNAYYYIVSAFDSCQNSYPSPYVKTVHLGGELYDYYIANLEWNFFELQGATVAEYRLHRNYGQGFQQIQTFSPTTNTFSDSLQQFLSEKGIFCYKIEAVYNLSLPNGYQATLSSFSNEMCIIHRPIIYIPNAFAPDGLNNIFKPTIIYGEPKAYTMQIYNRYGGKVFESNDPAAGWDGTDHGKNAQPGGYGYLIQFYANDGVKVERKGMVLLVR